jgi:hypothetical protein
MKWGITRRFESVNELEFAKNSPPKLGGVPFARFLANGGVVPQEEPPRLRL